MMPLRIFPALALAGLMLLDGVSGLAAIAGEQDTSLQVQSPGSNNNPSVRLPQAVANAVRRDVSRRTGLPPEKVKITEVTQETFPNSCLGLPRPDEVCAQVLVEGFRIVAFPDISDTSRVRPFIYRSDRTGQNLRLENEFPTTTTSSNLPKAVADAVLQAASQRTGQPTSALKIVQAERQTWPNGCLGLSEPGTVCTQALVEGWLVKVGVKSGQLVYRTNESGSLVKLDKAASTKGNSTVKPVKIPQNELPPPLAQGEVFRMISSGGIAGQTTVTTLLADGQLVRTPATPGGTVTRTLIGRVSRQQVRQFQQLLDRQQFAQFDRLSYPAPSGAADFFTITLTSQKATVRYVDLAQDRLPRKLQQVIRAFDQLTSRARTSNPK